METDERDRQKEREELEEIRKKLLEDGHPDPEAEMERVCTSYRLADVCLIWQTH